MRASKIARLSSRPDVPGAYRLALPPALDLVVGKRAVLYFEEICVSPSPGAALPAFTMQGPGALDAVSWSWTPEASDAGTRKLRLSTPDGTISRQLTIRPETMPTPTTIKVHAIGASFLTAAVPGNWLEFVDDDTTTAGGTIEWLGTTQAVGQTADIWSEAQAGSSFLWWSGEDQGAGWGPCPYQFGSYGDPLDPLRYAAEELGGATPDVVIVDVNTNSYGTMRLDVPGDLVTIMAQFDKLTDALIEAWPNAWICHVPGPPCAQDMHPLGDDYRLRRHLFVETAYANIRTRRLAGQRVTACQELGSIDPVAGFPGGNDHWDLDGGIEIGRSMYTFLRKFTG